MNDKDMYEYLTERYPLLKTYKTEDENWRQFFVKMIYYIEKLEEEFDVTYMRNHSYNPEQFYKQLISIQEDV